MEFVGYGVMSIGGLIAFIGWICLIVLGFQKGGALWGILNIFFQPITGIIFCFMHKTGWIALAMLIIGNIIAVVGMVPVIMNIIETMPR